MLEKKGERKKAMNTMKRIFSEESLTCVPKSRAYKKALAALSEAAQDISALFAESTGSDASRLFERYQDASAEVQELICTEAFRQGFHLGRELQEEISEWERDCE